MRLSAFTVIPAKDQMRHIASPSPAYVLKTSVSYDGGPTTKGELQLGAELVAMVEEMLAKVHDGGLRFGDEKDTAERPFVVYYRGQVYGGGKVVRDIDLVATASPMAIRKLSSCGTYQSQEYVASVTVERHARDQRVMVFDRRSGKRVAERVFRGQQPKCPDAVVVSSPQVGEVDQAEVVAWLRTLAD